MPKAKFHWQVVIEFYQWSLPHQMLKNLFQGQLGFLFQGQYIMFTTFFKESKDNPFFKETMHLFQDKRTMENTVATSNVLFQGAASQLQCHVLFQGWCHALFQGQLPTFFKVQYSFLHLAYEAWLAKSAAGFDIWEQAWY